MSVGRGDRGHVPDDGRKVGRAPQRDLRQNGLVGANDAANAGAVRVGRVARQREAVADSAVGQLGAKAKGWEVLVRVVVLNNAAHGVDGLHVSGHQERRGKWEEGEASGSEMGWKNCREQKEATYWLGTIGFW